MTDILTAVDETVTRCTPAPGPRARSRDSKAQSLTNRLWQSFSAHVYVYLHQTRLSDVVHNELAPCPAVPTLLQRVDDDSHDAEVDADA